MTTFVIATEAGIKIEVKENLKKDQVKKLENNFSEVKDFVEDKSNAVVITAQEKHIILGMMLQQVSSPDAIKAASLMIEELMKDTIKFINDLSDDKKIQDESKNEHNGRDVSDYLDDAFEAIRKRFPERAILLMAAESDGKSFAVCGNMNPQAAIMFLFSADLDKIRAAHESR